MRRRSGAALLLLTLARRSGAALVLLTLACRSVPDSLPLPSDDPRPAAFVAAQLARETSLDGLRARTRVHVTGSRAAPLSSQLLLVERPARLRVEVLGLMGQRIMVLATDGASYDLYTAETAGIEHGEVHPAILEQVAGLPLTPEAAVSLLLGTPSMAGAAGATAWRPSEDRIALRWSLGTKGPLRTAVFDHEGRLRAFQIGAADPDQLRLDARFDDYRLLDQRAFAHRVRLHFPAEGTSVDVRFSAVELDPALSPALFRLELPGRVSSGSGGEE